MDDTAQPLTAAETDPNALIGNAADAFKAFDADEPIERPRDDIGRFAAAQEELAEVEDEAEPQGEAEDDTEADEDEAEEAAQAHPMPPSWGADDEALWSSIPPEAQARIAGREGERDRAVNLKFQEAATIRKTAEEARIEAASSRKEYADALNMMMSVIQPVKPDPRAFGAGTGQYNSEAYELAKAEFEQQSTALAQLQQQRDAIRQQEAEDSSRAFAAWKQEHEAQYAPKLLEDVPELKDAAKAEPFLRDLVQYAIAAGIPSETFDEDQQDAITSAQLHLVWKAQQFDKLRNTPAGAKPKPTSPGVRPGVSSPRSAQKAARRTKDFDRLSREGSIQAGAAVFKHFL